MGTAWLGETSPSLAPLFAHPPVSPPLGLLLPLPSINSPIPKVPADCATLATQHSREDSCEVRRQPSRAMLPDWTLHQQAPFSAAKPPAPALGSQRGGSTRTGSTTQSPTCLPQPLALQEQAGGGSLGDSSGAWVGPGEAVWEGLAFPCLCYPRP